MGDVLTNPLDPTIPSDYRTAREYGPDVLRLTVSRQALRIPPELKGYASTVAQALKSHDVALLLGTVHPQQIKRAKGGSR